MIRAPRRFRGLGVALAMALACAPATRPPRTAKTPPPELPPAVEPAIPVPPLPPTAPPGPAPPAPSPRPALGAPQPAAPLAFAGRVRVGLATDLEEVTLPCCDGEISAEGGGVRIEVVSPVRVRSAVRGGGQSIYRLQIAALKDDRQAADLAARVAARTGAPADARFDAATGLFRVRVGRYPSREEAEGEGRKLARIGVDSFWVVSEGPGLASPALEVAQRGKARHVDGRRFVLAASEGGGVRYEGHRYRGALVVYLNDRGRLNLINELPVEDYLRGVVPVEMGPSSYPEPAALAAQAIAARTYTLRNLGEFADEGYDICATPRCQVYGGMDAEAALSDRAVAETAGRILTYGDGATREPIDALYSATCGGHTENVEVVFP